MKKGIEDLKKELVGEIKDLAAEIAKSHSYIGLLSNEIKFRSLYEKFINLKFLEKKQYGLEVFEPDIIPIDDDFEDIERKNLHNDLDPELNLTLKSAKHITEQEAIPESDSEKTTLVNTEEAKEEVEKEETKETGEDKIVKVLSEGNATSVNIYASGKVTIVNDDIDYYEEFASMDEYDAFLTEGMEDLVPLLDDSTTKEKTQADEISNEPLKFNFEENLTESKEKTSQEDGNDDKESCESHTDLVENIDEKIIIEDQPLEEIQDDSQKIYLDELPKNSNTPVHKFIKPLQLDLNDQLAFQHQLFDGDSESMNMVIRTLNALNSLSDSQAYLRDLKTEMEWDDKEEYIERLEELIIKRFD